MNKALKNIIKKIFRSFGIKIGGISKNELTDEKKVEWFKKFNFKTVIDVGASKGNASLQFRKLFPEADIYAFEPLTDCFNLIKEKVRNLNNINIFNLALSDFAGEGQIFRSSYSGASSLIKMSPLQKEIFPVTAGESLQKVRVDTLDNILGQERLKKPILIKLDVQGTEDKVIGGGKLIFGKARAIITETSFCRLYENQPLFNDICRQLEDSGFRYAGIWGDGDFRSPTDGRPLQQDSIFIRD